MCEKKRKSGFAPLCLSPSALGVVGLALIAVGVLLILIFVPFRYWMAVLGVVLLAAGIALRTLT